ncbi:hypothetical protein BD779DRAFT_1175754 [Infundibulicybe gibba]|nr:hypothetical protein BD779DRAFT_1175754 [Infundibulicybe gibba]
MDGDHSQNTPAHSSTRCLWRSKSRASPSSGPPDIASGPICIRSRLREHHQGRGSIPPALEYPTDFEKYAASSTAPLLMNSCTNDKQFPHEAQAQADAVLGDGKFTPGYKREYWDGCTHGFAVRGDVNDPKAKAGKEGAFKAAVEWLSKL